jgi:hypothetical protein
MRHLRHHEDHPPNDQGSQSLTRQERGTWTLARRWTAALAVSAAMILPLVGLSTQAQAATAPHQGNSVATVVIAAAHSPSRSATYQRPMTGGWGYVSDGNLRTNPNLGAAVKVTIFNQWVNILCWIDGGPNGFGSNRWFKAQYFSLQGYLSSGVVSSQPTVGQC